MKSKIILLPLIGSWGIMLVIPPMLMMTSIFALINPVYLNIEYRRPGFPADNYGFTLNDRLKYGSISAAYLLNSKAISYLEEIKLPSGDNLYNDRELSHMDDVKEVVQVALRWWLAGLATLILLGIWLFSGTRKRYYLLGLLRGGDLTIGLIILLLIGIAVNFDSIFTYFHKIFFESGTWVFYYTDSLIRLFPITFWQDTFLTVSGLCLSGGIILRLVGKRQLNAKKS